jgi:dTDP-4-amino-4,6-dideoxygalactose transaminase
MEQKIISINQQSTPSIQMVDVKGQYLKIKEEIDQNIQEVIDSCAFINGPKVKSFQKSLEGYLGVDHVIPCANGTDALQIALMALDLQPGDKVMVPAFTYVATAEVIGLLGLHPIMVDVDPHTFNLSAEIVENALTPDIKAVVPVHLYGQSSEMEGIMALAEKHNFYVIEDNAQAIGADYISSDGQKQKTGTIGHIGTTSFYPSKNLGAYGDGGAIMTNDPRLGEKIRKIANHGQGKKYVHDLIGCNSRLDSIQAAILQVKLRYLDSYCAARIDVADNYDSAFDGIANIETPFRAVYSSHVFHQYTVKIKNGRRDDLKQYLQESGIPSMIYYPIPLYKQKAFAKYAAPDLNLPVTEQLCKEVISLPVHTEMSDEQLQFVASKVNEFCK